MVRGADLLDSTPRQLWLYEHLGLTAPSVWAHVPLMLGADGTRLAKRHGAVTLEERLAAGDSVEAITGELAASAGLAAPGREMSARDLVDGFTWSNL